MVRGKDFRQPRFGDVRINLRGGEIAVAEQHLHHAQVGAVIDEMGRKGVAQGVRRDGGANADGNRIIMMSFQKVRRFIAPPRAAMNSTSLTRPSSSRGRASRQ